MASAGDIYGGLSAGDWLAQSMQPNPRSAPSGADEGWTPFKQGQLRQGDAGYDATWDPNTQSVAPQRGYVMGGYAAPQASDAQGNGVDPLADPNNKTWGNGESWNEHVADIGNRNAQSQQYNAGEDARYAKDLAGWTAAHPAQTQQAPMTPGAPPAAPVTGAPPPVRRAPVGDQQQPQDAGPGLGGFMAGAKAPHPSMPAPAGGGGGFGGQSGAARRSRFGGAGGWGKLF